MKRMLLLFSVLLLSALSLNAQTQIERAGLSALLSTTAQVPAPPTNAPINLNTNSGTPFLSGPLVDAFKFFGTGSNWVVCPFGTIVESSAKHYDFGGGIALAYKVNDFVMPMFRLDYLRNQLWMPSADLQLQAPLTLFGKVTTIPFAFTGLATPVSGAGSNNGSPVGIFGAGLALRLDFISSTGFFAKSDLVGDYEMWTGGGFDNQKQFRLGLAYRF